uniref:Serine/threonine protein phosphatase 7 long form isogeny n=1 Tax=Cajanus cajan TaxID=3821 RepID=A0A151T4H6_CAJCA|nr:Serine/threonine protein phosphatase 7 long form isogeny [Cajanus cajan]
MAEIHEGICAAHQVGEKMKWVLSRKSFPLNQHCRAYILRLIGGVIMSDNYGNRLHLMYLPLLADLERAGRYSWGSTCLAHLYKEMCREIYPSSKKMSGCSLLLQSWAWYHMPFIQLRVQRDITFLLALRYELIFIPL